MRIEDAKKILQEAEARGETEVLAMIITEDDVRTQWEWEWERWDASSPPNFDSEDIHMIMDYIKSWDSFDTESLSTTIEELFQKSPYIVDEQSDMYLHIRQKFKEHFEAIE